MKEVETTISSFVQNQFPAFYQQEGDNFISFVKAYYEWMEQNYQYIELEDSTDFEVGDVVTQTPDTHTVVGVIEAIDGDYILVRVTSYEPFRSKQNCDVIAPITSTSGGDTYITSVAAVTPGYTGRQVLQYRDIDTTIDEFILKFKQKYLTNIQFDTATNKQLLIKNSLDLYRSKGTDRCIDLFFRLVYATNAEVYYPGDDIFRLSDGEWIKPKYLEVTQSEKTVDLVGKQVTGLVSGATAFVERYIKRRVGNTVVNILYVSNITGDFDNNEPIKSTTLYADSPKVIGSLRSAEIIVGGSEFAVGDIVNINASRGDGGLARVAEVTDETGTVDFELQYGGFGYTTDTTPIISSKVLTLANVTTTNTAGYYHVLETVSQAKADVSFTSANGDFTVGDNIYRYSGPTVVGVGTILSVDQTSGSATGDLSVSIDSGSFGTGNAIVTTANTIGATIGTYTDRTATANVVGISTTGVFGVYSPTGTIVSGEEVYQISATGQVSNAVVANVSFSGANYQVSVNNMIGVFDTTTNVYFATSNTTGELANVSLSIGVYSVSGSFTNTESRAVYAGESNTTGYLTFISSGADADFDISVISETESVLINDDFIQSNNGIAASTYAYTDSTRKKALVASNTGFTVGTTVVQEISKIKFNPNTSINAADGFVTLPTANTKFAIGDIVYYTTDTGNTVITEMANGDPYIVSHSNTTGVILSVPHTNTALNSTNFPNFKSAAISQTGHNLSKVAVGVVANVALANITIQGGSIFNTFSASGGTPSTSVYGNSTLLVYGGSTNTSITSVTTGTSNNVANQEFVTVRLIDSGYGFPKNTTGDAGDIIYSCLTYNEYEIGTIERITAIDPGIGYTQDPFVLMAQSPVYGYDYHDYIIMINDVTGAFVEGEKFLQTASSVSYTYITVADETGFEIGEKVYQGTASAPTVVALIDDIYPANNTIKVRSANGTFGAAVLYSFITTANSLVTDTETFSILASAKGIVKSANSTQIDVKRISFENTFVAGQTVVGQTSGATATIYSVSEDYSTRQIGLNANVTSNVITSSGSVASLEVIDSGYGYTNGDIIDFVSSDGTRTGDAKISIRGIGSGSGYYKSSKGFLSTNKYLYDGDYYQEYSYEVLSRLPFDKYADIFKKVLHTSGTKLFGSVVLAEEGNTVITIGETSIEQVND